MQLAIPSLTNTSILATELWQKLESLADSEKIDQLLQSIWKNQENQELATDAYADLADQIDAEITAIKARIEYLVQIHSAAIKKLEGWRSRLDQNLLYQVRKWDCQSGNCWQAKTNSDSGKSAYL